MNGLVSPKRAAESYKYVNIPFFRLNRSLFSPMALRKSGFWLMAVTRYRSENSPTPFLIFVTFLSIRPTFRAPVRSFG